MISTCFTPRPEDTNDFAGWNPCGRIPSHKLCHHLVARVSFTCISENLKRNEESGVFGFHQISTQVFLEKTQKFVGFPTDYFTDFIPRLLITEFLLSPVKFLFFWVVMPLIQLNHHVEPWMRLPVQGLWVRVRKILHEPWLCLACQKARCLQNLFLSDEEKEI